MKHAPAAASTAAGEMLAALCCRCDHHSMNIYVEHDTRTIAALTRHEAPGCDGVIVKLGDPSVVLASTMRSNPLGSNWLLDVDCPGARIVSWSGTLGEMLLDAEPRNWMKPGFDALRAFCDEVSPQLVAHERTLCFQPHARHVLSDVQAAMRFLNDREQEPFEIALAPGSLLERSMLEKIEDHLHRAFEALGSRCSMLVLHDALPGEQDDAPLNAVPLGRGVLPQGLVRELMDRYVPDETPIVLMPQAIDEQLAWLAS